MASPFSTNELFLRSDRIAFGKIPPEVPSREERLLIVPDFQGYQLLFGLSSLVSTSQVGTLEDIYPQNASFTFDMFNNNLGIGISSPQYALDIQTNTGVRISGGMLIANAFGLQSVPTAALISTLPSYVFSPGSIPANAIASTGAIQGISVPTSALFSTLPTQLFAPSSIPLASLQSTGLIYASSILANSLYGDGFNVSNIPLANINADITGNFFKPNTIPLSALASTGQIWIKDGSIIAPTLSTGQIATSSLTTNFLSSLEIQVGNLFASSITTSSIYFRTLSTNAITTSSITVNGGVVASNFTGNGGGLFNIDPAVLNNVIPSDKFGYRLIAWDAINPYGNFLWIAGDVTFESAAPVLIKGNLTVQGATALNTVTANLYTGNGSGLFNLNAVSSLSLQSSITGLGSSGYVSTASLVSTVNFVNASFSSFSTSFGQIIGGTVTELDLFSTVGGLGNAGYVSTASLVSTVNFVNASFSSFSTSFGQIIGGTITDANLLSTVGGLGTAGYISTASLLSTVTGLGSARYISSPSLLSTVTGLGTAGYISSASLVSTTTAFQTAGFLSSPALLSTVAGLGTAGYISSLSLTSSLISTTNSIGAAISSFSTAFGPGGTNMDTIRSTVAGLGTAGYVSTLSLTSSLISTTNFIGLSISSFSTAFGPGGTNMNAITSTVAGLGTAGYISTLSLTSSLISTTNFIGLSISSFSTAFGPGGTNIDTLTSTVRGLGSAGYVSTLSLTSSLISTTNFIGLSISSFSTAFGPGGTNIDTLTSTVRGLGSSGYISSLSLLSTVTGLGSSRYISTLSLTSSLISTTNFIGSAISTLSTAYRIQFNTVTSVISALTVSSLTFGTGDGFLAMPDIRPNAMSTLVTQTSSLQAFNLQIGATSTLTAIQFYGLQGNFNNTVLAERSIGTGAQEFIVFKGSSVSDQIRFQTTGIFEIETGVSSRLWSTVTQNATPSFIIDINSNVGIQTASPGATLDVAGTARAVTLSSQQLFVSSLNGSVPLTAAFLTTAGFISSPNLLSTVEGLGSIGYISSASLTSSFISTTNFINQSFSSFSTAFGPGGGLSIANLTSTVEGLGSIGYISSASLTSSFISTTNFINQSFSSFSTAFGPGGGLSIANLTSTVTGLGSIGYISSATLVSTTAGLERYISSFIDPQELASSVLQFISTTYFTTQLTSTVTGLGSAGYISSASLTSSFISTTNFINQSFSSFSTAFGPVAGGGITTANLTSTVAGLGRIGYLSSIPAILSTSAFFTSSAVISTATIGIMSSLITNASTANITVATTSSVTTNTMTIGTGGGWIFTSPIQTAALSTNTLWADQSYINTETVTTSIISTVTTNNITLGSGGGWILTSPIQTSIVSSIYTFANQPFFDTVNIGSVSTMNSLEYYGLFGNYNNTVLAEISTGGGFQELLVFKGSSSSDRVRVQTTGNFVVETGVSARLFNSNTTQTLSNATPAFIVNSSSNVGIQTASPGATLDVAGTARAINLSSQQLFVSSINGSIPLLATSLFSTVTGLGSIGYISTASLVSTTNFINQSFSSFSTAFGPGGGITTSNLTSTVGGLGSSGYISSFMNILNLSAQQIVASSIFATLAGPTTVVLYEY